MPDKYEITLMIALGIFFLIAVSFLLSRIVVWLDKKIDKCIEKRNEKRNKGG